MNSILLAIFFLTTLSGCWAQDSHSSQESGEIFHQELKEEELENIAQDVLSQARSVASNSYARVYSVATYNKVKNTKKKI